MNTIKRLALATAAASLATAAMAVPAKKGLMTYTQPDGRQIAVELRGDENSHYYLTDDGYVLLERSAGLYYAMPKSDGTLCATAYLARPAADRSQAERQMLAAIDRADAIRAVEAMRPAAPRRGMPAQRATSYGVGLFENFYYPVHGVQKSIVVLVEYTDVKFNMSDPYDYFYRLLNEEGFSEHGGTGSCRDYFIENSDGEFRPQFDLYGPLQLAHNQAYYGGNNWMGNDTNPHKMAIEACQMIDDEVDFAQYDRNGDGFIDNVYVFYAGRGEASGGGSNTVWPHSWQITAAESTPYVFDGVQLDHYACSNERDTSTPTGIGTFVHEFSHILGLPDLYATSYTSAFTPGAWSVLDYGPYNNDGRTPPRYGAFERNALGWCKPRAITAAVDISMPAIDTNCAYIIPTAKDSEFFLLENRQQTGWDAYIPGHGMLIWHIDYKASPWEKNTVNNSASHQYVDIEEADNKRDTGTRAGDAFPGTSGKTEFTDDTKPSMLTWSKERMNLPITGITETRGVVSFVVAGGDFAASAPFALSAADAGAGEFTARWQGLQRATGYLVDVYRVKRTHYDVDDASEPSLPDQEEGYGLPGPLGRRLVAVEGYTGIEAGDAAELRIEGLDPKGVYAYGVRATDGTTVSRRSNLVVVGDLDDARTPSGIADAEAQLPVCRLMGRTLTVDAKAQVYTPAGCLVATLAPFSPTTLAPGLYIVVTPQGAQKIAIK